VRSILRMHADRGELEVVRDLADPVPIWLMCELLGIGAEEHTTFASWSTDLGDALASVMTPERRAKAEQALVGLDERIRKLLAERRAEPGGDLLTALVAEADALEAPVDETELVTLVINLIFGGHDTSRSLLTVAVALLLAYPEQLERLRREPKLVEAAGEEILRFEPPIAVLAREPTEPIETSGARLEAGKMFFLSVLAANRDPAVFAYPDRLDIGREPVRSFSFGWGSHFCLGTALARAELQELLSVLVSETSRLERIGDAPRWVPFVSIRRLESLPIRYSMKSRS
jgi:cytochrome P450